MPSLYLSAKLEAIHTTQSEIDVDDPPENIGGCGSFLLNIPVNCLLDKFNSRVMTSGLVHALLSVVTSNHSCVKNQSPYEFGPSCEGSEYSQRNVTMTTRN